MHRAIFWILLFCTPACHGQNVWVGTGADFSNRLGYENGALFFAGAEAGPRHLLLTGEGQFGLADKFETPGNEIRGSLSSYLRTGPILFGPSLHYSSFNGKDFSKAATRIGVGGGWDGPRGRFTSEYIFGTAKSENYGLSGLQSDLRLFLPEYPHIAARLRIGIWHWHDYTGSHTAPNAQLGIEWHFSFQKRGAKPPKPNRGKSGFPLETF